jgi:Tfp pilus assembly major pilin PilA
MEIGGWASQNWFNLFSAIGIIASLWIAIFSLRSDTKTRRVANLLTITRNHREIWKEFLNNPKLTRVRNAAVDMAKQPITDAEEMFVGLVIAHTNSVYYTMSDKLIVEYEGLRRDISQFFSLPVPKAVWRKSKPLQNQDFAAFIESSLK